MSRSLPSARTLVAARKPRTLLVARGIRPATPAERSSKRFAAALVVAAAASPLPAAAGAGWVTKCPLDHSAMDDPIMFPGQPGMSHMHDFYANRSTNAFSTHDTMLAAPTTCGTAGDTAGYWTPALYRNGVRVFPQGAYAGRSTREQFYYRKDNLAAGSVIEPFPPDFRMILGYAHATSLDDAKAHGVPWGSEVYWGCADNKPDGKFSTPVDCTTGIVSLHLQFPNCWDGIQSGGDEIAAGNVRYPKGGVCPPGYEHKLPRLFERIEWPVGTSSSGLTVASGGPWSVHADFLNSWSQPTLARLVDACLNADRDCGTNPP